MNALRSRTAPAGSDTGSVLVGGLAKLVLLLVVVGVLVYDAVAIGYGRFSTAEHGKAAADQAGEAWRDSGSVQAAYDAAVAEIAKTGETIDPDSFRIQPDTDTVSFSVSSTARTLAAHRLGLTRELTVVEVDIETKSAAPSF